MDTTTLTPDQRASLEPLMADNVIPEFELHIQSIRAHLPIEAAPTTTPALATKPNSKPAALSRTSDEYIATDCIELRSESKYTDFFCTILESATTDNAWHVGRFFAHTLRFDSPFHHFACVSEQQLLANNTGYIQLQWAHPMVMHSPVHYDQVSNFQHILSPSTPPPTLATLLLSLPGLLPDDPILTPQFLAIEPTTTPGIWKFLCHRDLLQDNRAWIDTHFAALYRAAAAYNTLHSPNYDARFQQPHRRDDRYDRAQRAHTNASQSQLIVHVDRTKLAVQSISSRKLTPLSSTRRSQAVQVVDTSHFPHLHDAENPWQPVTRRTSRRPTHPPTQHNPSGPPKAPPASTATQPSPKKVSYADTATVNTAHTQHTAQTTGTNQTALDQHLTAMDSRLACT